MFTSSRTALAEPSRCFFASLARARAPAIAALPIARPPASRFWNENVTGIPRLWMSSSLETDPSHDRRAAAPPFCCLSCPLSQILETYTNIPAYRYGKAPPILSSLASHQK